MKLKFVINKLMLLLVIVLITGCSVSKEQAIELAKASFEVGVSEEAKEQNQTTDLFSYYLPADLQVEEITENNLILSKGDQLFLIFSNPAEGSLSQVNFEQDKLVEEKAILIEKQEIDGLFSYIIVSPFEDGKYKVIVGIGGEKGTTVTEIGDFKNSVDTLLDIIKSIKY
ncbi:hypothetical protein DS745_19970 [Anaerobacillus alkaliphilus]|uniref:Lipoprotein n=1 Tax=Anaerobacillus alkaliphilus TaxID=1548597 RepID=A0A4Q0VQ33_9BACI|nr:hypothetical protein [Anaerobacillus alkaliphilus]RXI98596.1 hypothetical protein DS745_19970 [Anaerobacillus alkaliphilus]